MKKLLIFASLVYIVFVITIALFGLMSHPTPGDIIVIFGNTVNSDGTPSPRLKSRLDKGLELYKNNFATKILVSGAVGKEGYSEPAAMKDYLLKNSIPNTDIIEDNSGTDTWSTAANANSLCHNHPCRHVILVSNYYHLLRTKIAFNRYAFEQISVSSASHFELRDIYSLIRESLAIPYYFLRPLNTGNPNINK